MSLRSIDQTKEKLKTAQSVCFDLEIKKKTSHAFVLQSWSRPAFLNFKTAGIWPLAAVLQHLYEQQAVPLASTPSEKKKEVCKKRMNIHEIFMTVKVSRGTSAVWLLNSTLNHLPEGFLRFLRETARRPARWCPRWGINQIKAFMISEQRWPVANHIKHSTGLWEIEVNQSEEDLTLTTWSKSTQRLAKPLQEPANPDCNKVTMKGVYSLSCRTKHKRIATKLKA